MATITEDYVSFETAKLLKEKGFDVPFYFFYRTDDRMIHHVVKATPLVYDNNIDDEVISAPTHQTVMKWLREVHNIHISVYVFNRELPITDVPISYTCDIATKKLSSQQGHLRGVWQSYEQACEAAIIYCLENLI